jgi:hypothetical protein
MAKLYREEAGNGLHVHQSLRPPVGGTPSPPRPRSDGPSAELMRRWLTGFAHQLERPPSIRRSTRTSASRTTCAHVRDLGRRQCRRRRARHHGLGEVPARGPRAAADANPYLPSPASSTPVGRPRSRPAATRVHGGRRLRGHDLTTAPATLQTLDASSRAPVTASLGDMFRTLATMGRHEVGLFRAAGDGVGARALQEVV